MPPKKIAIIGATSAMAEHCARLWLAQQPTTELILVGRDLPRTQRVAADLQVRSPQARIHVVQVNLRDTPADTDEQLDLLQIPTALSIQPHEVSKLIAAGRSVLRHSATFQALRDDLDAVSPVLR